MALSRREQVTVRENLDAPNNRQISRSLQQLNYFLYTNPNDEEDRRDNQYMEYDTNKRPQFTYFKALIKRQSYERRTWNSDNNNPIFSANKTVIRNMLMSETIKEYDLAGQKHPMRDDFRESLLDQSTKPHPYPMPTVHLADLKRYFADEIKLQLKLDCLEFFGHWDGHSLLPVFLKLRREDQFTFEAHVEDNYTSEDGTRIEHGIPDEIQQKDWKGALKFLSERGLPCRRLLRRFIDAAIPILPPLGEDSENELNITDSLTEWRKTEVFKETPSIEIDQCTGRETPPKRGRGRPKGQRR